MTAVIDIGSNSVRMLLTDKNTKEKFSVITKLIENCKDNLLDKPAIERCVNEVIKFIKRAKEKNCDIHIFATEALRRAKNSEEFTGKIFQATGLNVQILDDKEEAKIAFLGAGHFKRGEIAVLDIGGASTELVYGKSGNVDFSKSIPIGAVELFNICGKDQEKLEFVIKTHVKDFERKAYKSLIGVGGTVTSLAAFDLNLKWYDPNKVNGHILKKDAVKRMFEKLILLNDKETLKLYGIQKGRERYIAGGCLLLLNIMECLKAEKIIVSENDNLEGFIIYNKLKTVD